MVVETEYQRERKAGYDRTRRALGYAMECITSGDYEGEKIALRHCLELMLDLLGAFYGKEVDLQDAVEQHGVRDMQGAVQDIPEAGTAQEEGPREAHVVPVVQGGDEAPGEVLSRCCLSCKRAYVGKLFCVKEGRRPVEVPWHSCCLDYAERGARWAPSL